MKPSVKPNRVVKIERIDPVKRVFKKGKTRGRPSKAEIAIKNILNYEMRGNMKAINKMVSDLFLYGVCVGKTTFTAPKPTRTTKTNGRKNRGKCK